MRILLGYAADHFRPGVPPEQIERWGTSASIIARTLHELCTEHGDVTYVDVDEPESVAGQAFDLYVGIARNFERFLDSCEIARSIYVAVNMHPATHNALLGDFVARAHLPAEALHDRDVLDVSATTRALDRADQVLCFGNVAQWNSYVANGVPRRKIRVLNYGLPAAPRGATVSDHPGTRVVHVASEIGLRKGFDIVDDVLRRTDLEAADTRVDILGEAIWPHYQERLRRLCDDLGDRVVFHGHLDPGSPEYHALVGGADVLLFPSLEEGQAGTVIEALAHGVIPLISENCGVDFAPLGFCELALGSAHNAALLRDALDLTPRERDRLRARTREYYDEFHSGFREPLRSALAGAVAGDLWPKMSVVLPIYNKERTIGDLLRFLDRGLAAYGNAELHVLVDGCTDGSETEVRRFFATERGYPVRIDVTPNLFEIRTNNLGLREATGEYGVIVQDDNFVFDENFLFEAATFLEKDRRAAILGGLAGVNLYPRGTTGLQGPGQIVMADREVYWRQDADTDPALGRRFFGVDAVMRGPIFLRKSFLEEHGYLDEAYAPLHYDDMDICLRAASVGHKVYAVLMDVENDSLTAGSLSPEKAAQFDAWAERSMGIFYSRWTPSLDKDHLWVHRTRPLEASSRTAKALRLRQRLRRGWLLARRSRLNRNYALQTASAVKQRLLATRR